MRRTYDALEIKALSEQELEYLRSTGLFDQMFKDVYCADSPMKQKEKTDE